MAANLSENYEKLVLGLGVAVALGLGAMAYLNLGKLDAKFETPAGRNNDAPALPGQAEIDLAIDNLAKPPGAHTVKQAIVEGDRPVDLYTGIPWFIQREGNKPVDLGNSSESNVHDPIPNSWWLKHNLDPGFADSPKRDADGDGFTNEEEFLAKTDPTDFNSYGELVTKIEIVKLVNERYRLEFSSDAGSTYKFKYFDKFTGPLRTLNSKYVPAGDDANSIFFEKAPAMLKFKLRKVEKRSVESESTGIEMEKLFATVEVLTGSKKGDEFEIPKGDRNYIISDYKVILVLAAIGKGADEFELAERESFSLPHDPDSTDKPFTFKGVDKAGNVVVEWQQDGETKTRLLTP